MSFRRSDFLLHQLLEASCSFRLGRPLRTCSGCFLVRFEGPSAFPLRALHIGNRSFRQALADGYWTQPLVHRVADRKSAHVARSALWEDDDIESGGRKSTYSLSRVMSSEKSTPRHMNSGDVSARSAADACSVLERRSRCQPRRSCGSFRSSVVQFSWLRCDESISSLWTAPSPSSVSLDTFSRALNSMLQRLMPVSRSDPAHCAGARTGCRDHTRNLKSLQLGLVWPRARAAL